jgi:hypothetical protein
MLNNVKNEYNEVKALGLKQNNTVSVVSISEVKEEEKEEQDKPAIKLKIEETVATVATKVSGLMTPKKKELIIEISEDEEKEKEKTEEKTEEKK